MGMGGSRRVVCRVRPRSYLVSHPELRHRVSSDLRGGVSRQRLPVHTQIMAKPGRRRMNVTSYFGWVSVVLVVTVAAALEITGRGALVAAFLGSVILSETAFAQE